MKIQYLSPLVILLVNLAQASEVNSCSIHKRRSDCEVVRVVTRCDVDKQRLRSKISFLEKRVQELEATLRVVQLAKPSERIVEKFIYIDRTVQQTAPSSIEKKSDYHSILSLYTTQDVTGITASSNGSSSTATVQQSFVPGIKYQYIFDFGLVPEIGINTNLNPIFGLGWKF